MTKREYMRRRQRRNRAVFAGVLAVVLCVLLVVILVVFGYSRAHVLRRVRQSSRPAYRRLFLLTTLNEAFFIGQLAQVFYTLHLFCVLLYSVMPSDLHQNLMAERLL